MRLLFLFAIAAYAQKTTTHALTITAGAMHCTFQRREPAALSGLHWECVAAAASTKADAVLAIGSSSTGSFYAGPDSIQWELRRPTEGALMYKIVANEKIETGSL